MRRWSVWLIAAAALLVGVIGCGGEEDVDTFTVDIPPIPKEVDVTLDGYPGPENVGILMAHQRGYFEKVGLDVWIRTPVSRLGPLPYVVEGEVALSVSHQPQVVMAREKGAPIDAFGSLISEPTAALIWPKKAGIGGVADLKGKTIAITGLPFEESFLEAALDQAGLSLDDVKIIRADYDLLPTLVNGRADAILGSWNIEGAELEARGLQPVITRLEDLGIPSYDEWVLITRSERVDEEPGRIRGFMAALARGTAAAVEDPEAAARLIARQRGEKPSKALKDAVEATLPLLSESGSVSPDEELVDWMREKRMFQPPKKELEITLDGEPGPQNVGVLMADQRGYFDEVGLRVTIYRPETPRRPIPYVLRRWVDLSISHEPQIELAQERGFPIVAVQSLISEPTAAMIWSAKSGVNGIADLRDRTIAIPGLAFQRELLREVLGQVDLRLADVNVETAGYDLVPALISGRADAIFGGSGNVEGVELEASGLEPVVVPVQKLGIPSYDELVFIARADRLAEDPESIHDFLSAVGRGTEAAIDDPRAATEAINDFYVGAKGKMPRRAVEETLPLFSRSIAAGP